jgi:hypothetical protein
MTVERQTNVWIGKRRIIYFASRTQRLEKEVNFSSSCSADYQHWTYLSLYMYCPIVNYYTKWTEHKANLILLFRVFSSLSLSLLLLILTYNDLDYRKSNYSIVLVNVTRFHINRYNTRTKIHQRFIQMPLVCIDLIFELRKNNKNRFLFFFCRYEIDNLIEFVLFDMIKLDFLLNR